MTPRVEREQLHGPKTISKTVTTNHHRTTSNDRYVPTNQLHVDSGKLPRAKSKDSKRSPIMENRNYSPSTGSARTEPEGKTNISTII